MLMSSIMSVCLMLAPMLRTMDNATDQKVYQVAMHLYEAETLQGNIKKQIRSLSRPAVTVVSGKSGRMIVGGEEPIPFTKPVQFVPTGFIVCISVATGDQQSCFVRLNAENSPIQVKTDEMLVQTSNQVRLNGKIELGKPLSIRLSGEDKGKQTWIDITITEQQP